tara:strand:+ start:699 stop:929 length:231 start_codon:yes stop_codon:yes gene_type:complete
MQVKKKSVKSKQINNKGRLSPVARKKREETLKKKLGARWKTMSPQHKNELINKKPIPKKSIRGNSLPLSYGKKVKN